VNFRNFFREKIPHLLFGIVFFFVGFFTSIFGLTLKNIFVRSPILEENVGGYIEESTNKESDKNDGQTLLAKRINILILGYGGEGHEGGNLSDVIMVLSLDVKRKKASFISIPRDLWVEIPVRSDIKEKHKINMVWAIGLDDVRFPLKEGKYKGREGAFRLAKDLVGEVTGLPISYLIAIDFSGFVDLVDKLGGIEVDVPVTFDDFFYPIKGRENDTCGKSSAEISALEQKYKDTELHHQFTCRYEHIHFDKGKMFMDGETALKFVRSRSSQQHGGDFARMERQQRVILALKEKLLSLSGLKSIDDIFVEFSSLLKTDINLDGLKKLLDFLGDYNNYDINFLSLTSENVLLQTKSLDGQFILIPKEGEGVWRGLQMYILEEIEK